MATAETDTPDPAEPDSGPGGGPPRFTFEARGLVEDVKTWVDLKLQLLQLDVEDRIENALNRVVFAVIFGVLGFTSLLFVLLTLAFFLGSLWYSDTLGFLTVTILLLIATFTFRAMRPSLVKLRNLKDVSKDALGAPPKSPELPAPGAGPGSDARKAPSEGNDDKNA